VPPSSHERYAGLPALYTLLDQLARQTAPASYLEIGVRDGASLVCVLCAAPEIKRLVLADTWESDYGGSGRASHQHISVLLAALDATKDTLFLDGDSKATVPSLTEQFDIALIDGDHSNEGVLADLHSVIPLLSPSGILVCDDISNPKHPDLGRIVREYTQGQGLRTVTWDMRGVGAAAFQRVP
jgi:predicted O-methyltransferase YrrM